MRRPSPAGSALRPQARLHPQRSPHIRRSRRNSGTGCRRNAIARPPPRCAARVPRSPFCPPSARASRRPARSHPPTIRPIPADKSRAAAARRSSSRPARAPRRGAHSDRRADWISASCCALRALRAVRQKCGMSRTWRAQRGAGRRGSVGRISRAMDGRNARRVPQAFKSIGSRGVVC